MKIKTNSILAVMLLFLLTLVRGQHGIHNFGNLQLHQKGHLGFHTDFINDGSFERNLGLIGFYKSDNHLFISGAFSPSFYDFEIAVEDNLYINVPINIDNSLNFIYGNIQSGRENKSIYSKFNAQSHYEGVLNISKIDGYVAVEDHKEFRFPVGQGDVLKPLEIKFIDDIFFAKCGYFGENPDYPKSLAINLDTSRRDISLAGINNLEFWHMSTSGRIQLTLHWTSESNLSYYAEEVVNITVTGWNKQNKMWDNLGNAVFQGDLDQGFVTSNIFNANDYQFFTLGFLFNPKADEPGNYAISPNGDGINDYFSLKIIDESPKNELRVFNRAGLLVYEKSNYKDEFSGIGNRDIFLTGNYLPEGVYFYLLELKDINRSYQGYFYLITE